MNKGAALVGGVGLGAALMYFFDPDRGKRRRALVRDKIEAAENKMGEYASKMSRDIRNRAYGLAAETKSIFQHEDVPDGVLVDRVRAKLGRYPVHVGTIEVTASNGAVTLSGPIAAEALPKVLRATKFVRGVKEVDNQLDVRSDSGDVLDLPGTPPPLGA